MAAEAIAASDELAAQRRREGKQRMVFSPPMVHQWDLDGFEVPPLIMAELRQSPVEGVEEMSPDALMEYCFYAAFKSTCTDGELPISADKFYSAHMGPARPAGQPPLDAKKSAFKQIGKFIKHMHKSKAIAVRDVKASTQITARWPL